MDSIKKQLQNLFFSIDNTEPIELNNLSTKKDKRKHKHKKNKKINQNDNNSGISNFNGNFEIFVCVNTIGIRGETGLLYLFFSYFNLFFNM
jgi:hypothetical protein